LCLLDFGLLRDLEADYLEGERDVMRALADDDPGRVHDGLLSLGYLREPQAVDRDALFEHLATAGEWLLAPGFRRVDPAYATRILERGYPLTVFRVDAPPEHAAADTAAPAHGDPVLSLLGDLHAGAEWGAITGEHHSGKPTSTALGREDHAFHKPRARP
jgi:hypothetical protein